MTALEAKALSKKQRDHLDKLLEKYAASILCDLCNDEESEDIELIKSSKTDNTTSYGFDVKSSEVDWGQEKPNHYDEEVATKSPDKPDC